MNHTELLEAINNCTDMQELEKLLDYCVQNAQERLKKYAHYLHPKDIVKKENNMDND